MITFYKATAFRIIRIEPMRKFPIAAIAAKIRIRVPYVTDATRLKPENRLHQFVFNWNYTDAETSERRNR
jgi:hypothetical protein